MPGMTPWKRQIAISAISLVAVVGITETAAAQAHYPSRPITLIVPFPAGGANDTLARIVAERMRGSLGQPVIIENVTGASGSIGSNRLAHAVADGYTIGLGNTATHVINSAILKLKYDARDDFEPVSLLATQPLLIVANKATPANSLGELIDWLRANPDKSSMGTAGATLQLAGALFQKQTGTRFGFVPYRGTVLAMQDLIAGQIQMMIDLASNSFPQVRAGSIKAYAVTARSRLTAAPGIPTVDEAGLPGFDVSTWQALFAPKRTPLIVISKINAAVTEALADEAVRQRIADLLQEVIPRDQQGPEALRTLQEAEARKWSPIIKASGFKAAHD